ncbi:hypothetical protein F4780DRAFT_417336 [Xylariomycetidae sp. FL0641]|nr:hypothetical protein F4780DRAFT_417336 [Xylariomycetidae sp. FL0641]
MSDVDTSERGTDRGQGSVSSAASMPEGGRGQAVQQNLDEGWMLSWSPDARALNTISSSIIRQIEALTLSLGELHGHPHLRKLRKAIRQFFGIVPPVHNLPPELKEKIYTLVGMEASLITFSFEFISRYPPGGFPDGDDFEIPSIPSTPPRRKAGERFVEIKAQNLDKFNQELNVDSTFRHSGGLSTILGENVTYSGVEEEILGAVAPAITQLKATPGQRTSTEKETLEGLQKLLDQFSTHKPLEPFRIEVGDKILTPPVKPEVDWFYLPGFVQAYTDACDLEIKEFPQCESLKRVRCCVLQLEDIFRGLCRLRNRFRKGDERHEPLAQPVYTPRFDVHQSKECFLDAFAYLGDFDSRWEELHILVGNPTESFQPSQVSEVKATWKEGYDWRSRPRGNPPIIDTVPPVKDAFVIMMQYVKSECERWIDGYAQQCFDALETASCRPLLLDASFYRYPNLVPFRRWLSGPVGKRWRDTPGGKRWQLESHAGWAWMASAYGWKWLDSEEGVAWLNSGKSHPEEFLKSDYARRWARNAMNDWDTTVADRVWYKGEKGRQWKENNCPGGEAPPIMEYRPPDNPTTRDIGTAERRWKELFCITPPQKWDLCMVEGDKSALKVQ